MLVKAAVPADKGFRTEQFVRARVVWRERAGPDGSGRGGHAHQRAVLRVRRRDAGQRVRRPAARRQGRRARRQRLRRRSGLKAGDRLIVSGVQKIGDGAPVAAARLRLRHGRARHVRRLLHPPAHPLDRPARSSSSWPARSPIPTLPIAQYPELAPPQVNVTAFYTGANAQTVETAVTIPLEQAINGVEGMLYMTSTSTSSGVSTVTATFDVDRNQDLAAVDVQNRVATALGRLPNEVKNIGVTVTKASTGFVMAAGVYAENGRVRLAVPQQLPRRLRPRRAEARARRRRRHHLRRAQVRDAPVARPDAAGGARHHRRAT